MTTAQTAGPASEAPSDRVPLRRVELLLIFGFWTFIALLSSANALIDPRGRGMPFILPAAPVALAFIQAYSWAALTPLIFWLGGRFQLERAHWVSRIALLFCLGFVIAIGVDVIINFARIEWLYPPPPPPAAKFSPLPRIARFWFINEFIVYIAVLSAGLARDYFLRYRARREEAMRLQAHAAQLQAQLADARLAALRSQLNPHFLFNTLHAVSALVERDPRGVRRMIARLSELLRTTLDGAEEQEVPLEQELAFVQRYLEIMQIRFQGRLQVRTRVEPGVGAALVPNLILQPLVENAIKHGVSKINEPGKIEIHARREGESVVLSVCDNGPACWSGELRAEEGVGLRNTRERLVQLYGPAQSLILRALEGDGPDGVAVNGVVAEVSLPYHTEADLRTAGVVAAQV